MANITLPNIPIRGGVATLQNIDNHLRNVLSPVINQLNSALNIGQGEQAEVIEVYATEEQLPENKDDDLKNYNYLGAIKFRKLIGQQHLSDDQLPIAYPMNMNIVDYPVRGEYVIVNRIHEKVYYSNRINLHNNPNNSSMIGASTKFHISNQNSSAQKTLEGAESGIAENKETIDNVYLGDYFKPNFNIKQLVPNEGDVLINGRFGNSIRLGSSEETNSPAIKLRVGQLLDANNFEDGTAILENLAKKPLNAPIIENINSDGSSIWATINETVSLKPATKESTDFYFSTVKQSDRIEEFAGKQIILNSGKLIFNSKESGIYGFSNGPVEISTLNGFGVAAQQYVDINSPNVNIGRGSGEGEGNGPDGNVGKTNAVTIQTVNFDVLNETGYSVLASRGVSLGQTNYEPAVKGRTLEDLLTDLIDVVSDLASSITTVAVTPVIIPVLGVPTPQQYASEASNTAKAMGTLAGLQIKLNKMLSRVVELE